MDYEDETYFRSDRYNDYDDFPYDDNDVYSHRHEGRRKHCHHCGCQVQHRQKGCRCDCHQHHHDSRRNECDCHCEHDRGCDCDCRGNRRPHRVCRELARILREQKRPNRQDCGCAASIQQLTGSHRNVIIPFVLGTRDGRLFVEWGGRHRHSYATVFFSVVKVNCRYNEAVLELLKPNCPITNPHTGRVEKRRIRDVDYVVPTGERVFVDLSPIREVRRLPRDFVKRHR